MTLFDKILIANRGEIACRVIHTCRKLGIKSVAVYSTADAHAKHVAMADEKVCIGPPTVKESYLRVDKILDACKKTGAQAVHPGYGFLSENSDFSAQLAKNNITFIGPDAHAIESMGDKVNSKRLASEAGVNTIPGFIGYIEDDAHVIKVANEIGYPIMVKASAGGGGKGMRIAWNDKEAVESFHICKEEAAANFGNDAMLIEKFIEDPRHIEVQVIADRCGNTLYLPERECSIQRRNQKVIEEAPSTFIDPETRKAMGEQAAAMARKVDYVSAGTVEMVVDQKRNFYFLEMNTRLQVEHPITELITGVDLVEQMIRAAAGKPLSISQDSIKINGWATECRVYAEDPTKNYFPSIGRLSAYEEPEGDGVRIDSGILEGSQISVYYDPLISKLCTYGKDRGESIERMRHALDRYVIKGLRHNICLLRDVLSQSDYLSGNISTNYLAEHYKDGFKKAPLSAQEEKQLMAVTASVHAIRRNVMSNGTAPQAGEYFVEVLGLGKQQVIVNLDGRTAQVVIDGKTLSIEVDWRVDFPRIRATIDGEKLDYQFVGTNEVSYQMQFFGSVFDIRVLTPEQNAVYPHMLENVAADTSNCLVAPMPGVIVEIFVKEGDVVVAGEALATLEAMKMRNKLFAPKDGKITKIHSRVGKTVDEMDILMDIE